MPLISIFDNLQNWTQAREQLSIIPRYARFQMELRSSRVVNLNFFSDIFKRSESSFLIFPEQSQGKIFDQIFPRIFFLYIVEKLIEDFVFFARRRVDEGEGRWTKFDDWKNSSRFSASIVKVV